MEHYTGILRMLVWATRIEVVVRGWPAGKVRRAILVRGEVLVENDDRQLRNHRLFDRRQRGNLIGIARSRRELLETSIDAGITETLPVGGVRLLTRGSGVDAIQQRVQWIVRAWSLVGPADRRVKLAG